MSDTNAEVVGDVFEPFGEAGIPKADTADEREDGESQDDGRAFGSLELHAVGLNKKPAQLKAALVYEIIKAVLMFLVLVLVVVVMAGGGGDVFIGVVVFKIHFVEVGGAEGVKNFFEDFV